RTIEAILWRHRNGAKRRALPADLVPVLISGGWPPRPSSAGPGWTSGSSSFSWSRIVACSSKRGSPEKRDRREALGRSRGGYGTKACVIADGAGRALAFRIAPG